MIGKVLLWMVASAMVLTLSQPASADTGRTVHGSFEFYAIGQGDVGGFCLNDPVSPVPPEGAAFQSCTEATPLPNEDHVGITVVDSQGQAVYFTVQVSSGGFAWGCGVITSHPGGLLPLNGGGPGGGQPGSVLVFPWAGPGLGDFPGTLDPDDICPGSVDPNIIQPGETGTVTFVFHDHV